MSKLFISKKRRSLVSPIKIHGHYYDNKVDSCFQEIGQIAPIIINAEMGNQLLITLNVPDTWCDKAGDGAWFAISVNDQIVARGVYYCGIDGQRVPITVQTVIDAATDERYIVRAMWCNERGTQDRNCSIGEYSETTLTVLQLD